MIEQATVYVVESLSGGQRDPKTILRTLSAAEAEAARAREASCLNVRATVREEDGIRVRGYVYLECADRPTDETIWQTPREAQGQIVEVQYGASRVGDATPGAPWRRVIDSSVARNAAGRETYYRLIGAPQAS